MENEKLKFSLKDILYIIKKYLIIELIVIVIAIGLGVFKCATTDHYYSASMVLGVEIQIDEDFNQSVYNDSTLTDMRIAKVKAFITSDIVMNRASKIAPSTLYGGNCTTKVGEGTITISYKDNHPTNAKVNAEGNLKAIVTAVMDLVNEGEDGTHYIITNGKVILTKWTMNYEAHEENTDMTTMLIFASVGVVGAIGLAILLYTVSDKVSNVDRVESITGKKNIMSIGESKKKAKGDANELLLLNVDKLSDSLLFLHNSNDKNSNKVYQIQSALHGEGKSTVASNLAIALGKLGKKVLVLECDFHKPAVYKYFGLNRHKGITDYFKDKFTFSEVVKKCSYENVDVITCGERIDNPTLLFISQKFDTLMEEARNNYDFVLLDCAPVCLTSDYISISRHVDSTLLVVGSEKVSSSQLKRTVSDLTASGTDIVGTVFNRTSKVRGGYYYYYYGNHDDESTVTND